MTSQPAPAVEMTIKGLILDPTSKTPIVILRHEETKALLPIWIGLCEANAIALELEGIRSPRPMTHDLLANVIRSFGSTIPDIVIHSLSDSVFYATIHVLHLDGTVSDIDSRPSDALALALRTSSKILVAEGVLAQAKVDEASEEEALANLLEKMRPEDLGDYEM
jgi:bifunctional DNase/RNase